MAESHLRSTCIYLGSGWMRFHLLYLLGILLRLFFFFFVHPQWHLGFFKSEYTPTKRGFDSFFGYWSGKEDYWDHSSDAPGQGWGLDFHNNTKVSECAREYLIFLSQMELFG